MEDLGRIFKTIKNQHLNQVLFHQRYLVKI